MTRKTDPRIFRLPVTHDWLVNFNSFTFQQNLRSINYLIIWLNYFWFTQGFYLVKNRIIFEDKLAYYWHLVLYGLSQRFSRRKDHIRKRRTLLTLVHRRPKFGLSTELRSLLRRRLKSSFRRRFLMKKLGLGHQGKFQLRWSSFVFRKQWLLAKEHEQTYSRFYRRLKYRQKRRLRRRLINKKRNYNFKNKFNYKDKMKFKRKRRRWGRKKKLRLRHRRFRFLNLLLFQKILVVRLKNFVEEMLGSFTRKINYVTFTLHVAVPKIRFFHFTFPLRPLRLFKVSKSSSLYYLATMFPRFIGKYFHFYALINLGELMQLAILSFYYYQCRVLMQWLYRRLKEVRKHDHRVSHKSFFYHFTSTVESIGILLGRLRGLRLSVSGKVNGVDRTTHYHIISGKQVPRQQLVVDANVHYTAASVPTYTGVLYVQLWLLLKVPV